MLNSTQRTSILSTLDFNAQQCLSKLDFNNQRRVSINNDINNDVKTKIKVNKPDLYYKDRITLED